jgi:hypothetical protein
MTRFFPIIFFTPFLFFACQPDSKEANTRQPLPLAIDSITGAPVGLPNPWKNAGCDLVTDAEVIKLFNIDPKRDALNTRTLPDRGFCLRSWYRPDWKERESNNEKPNAEYKEFKNTLVTQVLDYGTEAVSKDQFEMVRRDQRDTFEAEVPGLGDGAVWSTSTTSLMVKKGHLVVKITLDHQDTPQDNLPMAKEVAKLALQKML